MSVRVLDFQFFPLKIKCIENPTGHKEVLDTIFPTLDCGKITRTDPFFGVTGSESPPVNKLFHYPTNSLFH